MSKSLSFSPIRQAFLYSSESSSFGPEFSVVLGRIANFTVCWSAKNLGFEGFPVQIGILTAFRFLLAVKLNIKSS